MYNRRFNIASYWLQYLVAGLLLLTFVRADVKSRSKAKHKDLGVAVDLAQYKTQGGVLLEVYLLVPRANFEYQPVAGGGQAARLFFQVALIQEDSVRYLDRWSRTYQVKALSEIAANQKIPDITSFAALAGKYTLYAEIIDLNKDVRQTIEMPVSLVAFGDSELTISDLELANNIVTTQKENEFTKYGRDVVPNADRIFGYEAHRFYYFAEIYNLSGQGEFEITKEITDLNGAVVRDFPPRKKQMPGKSAVEIGAINVKGIHSGIYQLRLRVRDLPWETETTRSKTFYIYHPNEADSTEPAGEYDTLLEKQLDQIYAVAKILMDKNEKRLYENSDVTGKRNVLSAFWEREDPDPATPVNEFKRKFYDRVEIANRELANGNKPGWQTARGQILIKYGRPNEIERSPLTTDSRPSETWYYYNIEGGVEFNFVDKRGYGDYELVNSTARNEVNDPNWQRWLR